MFDRSTQYSKSTNRNTTYHNTIERLEELPSLKEFELGILMPPAWSWIHDKASQAEYFVKVDCKHNVLATSLR